MSLFAIPDWNKIFPIILSYCDFRTVITLNCSHNRFIRFCQKENLRRLKIYSSNPVEFEKACSEFFAVKCNCTRYCYVSKIENGFCKACNKTASNLINKKL
jgi:hypothetical protein